MKARAYCHMMQHHLHEVVGAEGCHRGAKRGPAFPAAAQGKGTVRLLVAATVLLVVAPLLCTASPVPPVAVAHRHKQQPKNASSSENDRLCEALRLSLPENCIVQTSDCFGFVCLVDMFGTVLSVEADLSGVCNDDTPSIKVGIQERLSKREKKQIALVLPRFKKSEHSEWLVVHPDADRSSSSWQQNEGCYDLSLHQCDCGIPDAETCSALNEPGSFPRFFWAPGCDSCFQPRDWSFQFEKNELPSNSTRRMAGLQYTVPACDNDDGAAGFLNGRLARSVGSDNLTDIALGLESCCGDDNPTVPDGCYDISVHQCDCGEFYSLDDGGGGGDSLRGGSD